MPSSRARPSMRPLWLSSGHFHAAYSRIVIRSDAFTCSRSVLEHFSNFATFRSVMVGTMETGRIGKVHTTMGLTRWLAGAGIDPNWFYALPRRGKARHGNGGDLRTHGLDGRSPAAGEDRAATLDPG